MPPFVIAHISDLHLSTFGDTYHDRARIVPRGKEPIDATQMATHFMLLALSPDGVRHDDRQRVRRRGIEGFHELPHLLRIGTDQARASAGSHGPTVWVHSAPPREGRRAAPVRRVE